MNSSNANPPSAPLQQSETFSQYYLWGWSLSAWKRFCRKWPTVLKQIAFFVSEWPLVQHISHFSVPTYPFTIPLFFSSAQPVLSCLWKSSHMLCSIRAGGKPQVKPTPPLALTSNVHSQIHVATGFSNQLWKFLLSSFWSRSRTLTLFRFKIFYESRDVILSPQLFAMD